MRLSAALLVLLAAAGCGSAATEEAGTEPSSGNTSRVEMVWTRTDEQGRMVMSGVADYGRDAGVFRVQLQGAAEEIPQAGSNGEQGDELRVFGNTSYAEWTIDGRDYWAEAPEEPSTYPDELIVPFPGNGRLDPERAATLILDAAQRIADPVDDDVRGAPTTHYRVMVDPKKLARLLPEDRQPNSDDPSLTDVFPVDLWVDEQERARRIRIQDEMTGDDSMTVTYDFFDFGLEVDIRRPPEEQVVSEEELSQMTEPTPEEMRELCLEEIPEEECAQMEKEGG
jgi:hypothetical protein